MIKLPVSVIITTYNDADYLSGAIESVLNQTIPPMQLIIVDDGSRTNDAKEVVDSYKFNDKEINTTFFRKKNGGASSARNYGLKYVDEKFIAFLDADDRMLKDNLELKYNAIKDLNNNYFGVYGSGITSEGVNYNFCDTDGIVCTSLVGFYNYGIPGGCPYYLFRTDSLVSIGGLDEELANNEDFDLIVRLLMAGQYCKGVIGRSIFLTVREDSLSRNSNHEKIFNNTMKFIQKAEKNNYFDKKELNKRKSIANLFLARRVFYTNPIKSLKHISKALSYTKNPVGLYRMYKRR